MRAVMEGGGLNWMQGCAGTRSVLDDTLDSSPGRFFPAGWPPSKTLASGSPLPRKTSPSMSGPLPDAQG